ncbi:tlde1 domain-containing protein, partial [Paraburkholderia heleia]
MTYTGKFLVNNKHLSPLTIDGLGTFDAYSGDQIYRNRGGCTAVVGKGPIPAGKYWIVTRPGGGAGSKALAWIKDAWNAYDGNP